jgi:RNA polymerase sigma-70 factor (ECF subfamily)
VKSSFKNNSSLINYLRKGDEKAYIYLVETYHKPLFAYALSLNTKYALAEDIVQIIFLKTWEHRERLNPNYSLKSFLYTSIYNEFINQYHKYKALSVLEEAYIEALDEVIIDTDNLNLLEQKIALLTKGINLLPPKCKETFLLSKKEGLTNIEIAEYLNISIKTVEGQITKAYKMLKNQIGLQLDSILFLLFGKVNYP